MPKFNKEELTTFVHRHGGPFDRGTADYYYGRPYKPHYFMGDTYNSPEIIERDMTEKEVEEYQRNRCGKGEGSCLLAACIVHVAWHGDTCDSG